MTNRRGLKTFHTGDFFNSPKSRGKKEQVWLEAHFFTIVVKQ